MKNTHIEWATHTFNPWMGCTKVSAGCVNCCAETRDARFGGGIAPHWGKGAPRQRTSAANWREPLKWNREAEKAGTRPRVFCASLADVFDAEISDEWRDDLWMLIADTPHLDWLLLTKRPENIGRMIPWADGRPENDWKADVSMWPNAWLGTSVENQAAADLRIPALLGIPARVRFLSCEPLLGTINLELLQATWCPECDGWTPQDVPTASVYCEPCGWESSDAIKNSQIHWVICGGESGPNARPMHPDWARGLRDQCNAAGAVFHFKQWGEWAPVKDELRSYRQHIIGGNPDHVKAIARMARAHGATKIFTPCRDFPLDIDRVQYGFIEHLARVGKKAAGRLLDGREWNELPKAKGETL